MSIRRAAILPLTLVAHIALSGCVAPKVDAPHAYPTDLTVDVTVLAGRGVSPTPGVHHRTARYIVFPDGSMHADVGPTLRADVRPGLTRRLRDDETEALWRTVIDTGLAEDERFDLPTNDALLEPPRGIVAHIVTIEANGRRWQVIRAMPPDAIDESDTTPLVRTLAGLSWESDLLPDALLPGGIRYEFGDDPHAAYRDVGVTPPLPERRSSTEPRR